jgi:epoxyqueuosine reductase
VLKERLWSLAEAIGAFAGRDVAARPCVDSAPVLERDLAEAAGLGFTGKNTMLITPGLGSYTLLGELLLDVEVAPTPVAERDIKQRCGTCRTCLDACPTQAFPAPFVLDARRCVSYLTIEHRGAIEPALRPGLGTMVFGCDVCQDACPFNARAPERHAPDPALAPRAPDSGAPDLLRLLALGANQYRRRVEGTALRRASREQMVRNVCVALGNAGDARAVPALVRLLADRSAVVRGHAAWALGQLGAAGALAEALAHERDPAVQDELHAALAHARARPA